MKYDIIALLTAKETVTLSRHDVVTLQVGCYPILGFGVK